MNSHHLRLAYLFVAIISLTGLYFVLKNSMFADLYTDIDFLMVRIRELGVVGPLLLMLLMILAIVFNPLPSAPIALAAGAVYGHTLGTIYIVTGAELGAIIAFLIARFAGHEVVSRYLGRHLSLSRLSSQNALMVAVFVSRLIPFMSFDLVSYLAGLSPLKLWRFAAATLLGLIPVSFTLAHLGEEAVYADTGSLVSIILAVGLVTAVPLIYALYRSSASDNSTDEK